MSLESVFPAVAAGALTLSEAAETALRECNKQLKHREDHGLDVGY
jgi:hypothetical protein